MQEVVDVVVQMKYDRIREEAHTENQQFLDSIDEGMKKVTKKQVKKEVLKITPKIEKLVNEQLESEVLVRSSKEAKTSHAVAANLSELELKKILIDKMEANKFINRSDIQRQLYQALVDAYEAGKILLETYGDTVTIKRPRDGADDDQEPSAGTDWGSKRRRSTFKRNERELQSLTELNTFVKKLQSQQQKNWTGISHWGKKRRQFYAFAIIRESARDVYSKRKIIAVTKVEIVEWQNYKHLDWITNVQRSVVIQRRVEDLQLGVEIYQKKLNLTKPDTYRSNLRRRDAYTPYSDPRGFIYENKDKKNRLMRIDELHKFSDGTLDDVRTALNDRLKGIRMEYLLRLSPFWSQN
ncbi:hypothetical protein Tco_0090018 [Tanacetum coccineum]